MKSFYAYIENIFLKKGVYILQNSKYYGGGGQMAAGKKMKTEGVGEIN